MKPWEVLSDELLLDCSPWLRIRSEHVRLPNGHEIPDFYRIEMPDWAQIFALSEDGRVMTVEHYKHGARMPSLELPAGYIEDGEPAEAAARRELLEETGIEAPEWRFLGKFFVDGNRGCGSTHIFLARHAREVAQPRLEASEIMTQQWLTLAELQATLRDGRIRNMGTVAAIGLALTALEG
jgi:ADP-ribose pyrophosphatase